MSAFSQLCQFIQLPQTPENLLQAQRLFHGRGKAYAGLEHVSVDWLPPVALITLFAYEPTSEIKKLTERLLHLLPSCRSVQLQHRYELSGPIDVLYGDVIQQLHIQEGDLQFHIRLGQSKNSGLFLDMKNGRQWVQKHSKDKRVLNLFAYTCGFSVAALTGNAKSILNVDMSSAALNVGRENHRLNHQSLDHVRFEKLNIFKSFSRLKKRGPFDFLICDPPTFQKGSINIKHDYPKILSRLGEFMASNATLVLCLNAPDIERRFLIDHMTLLAPQYTFIDEIKPPDVFVEPKGKGLKVICFKHIQKNSHW